MDSSLAAEELIKLADNYMKNDNYDLAVKNYYHAALQFCEAGKYYRSRDAFISMAGVILEKGAASLYYVLEKANELAKEFNKANVPEITGELFMFCSNSAYNLNDMKQSAFCFEKAYENYAMSNLEEEYRDVSVACLLKAAYSYYAIGESDKAEQLVLKAVELQHRMKKSVFEIENELSILTRKKQLKEAAEGYKELGELLLSEIESLAMLVDDFKDFDAVAINVKARLIHMAAENLLKANLCTEDEEKFDLKNATAQFEYAAQLMFGLINEQISDPEDIHRFGFDLLLTVILKNRVNGYKDAKAFYEDILEMFDDGLRPSIIKNKYVKTAKHLIDNETHLLLRALEKDLDIGRFEELREKFVELLKD